jgi:hypothetical protein
VKILRSIISVVVGYMLFAACVFSFFRIVGQPPHQDAPASVMVGSSVVGVIVAFLGGYVAAWLAGRQPLAHGLAMALVLATGALVSLVSTLGHGAIWSQLAAVFLMAPSAAVGGMARARQVA